MNTIAKIKTFLCKYFLLIEFCHRCGRTQPLDWWCEDDELYKNITGNEYSNYCPKCFDIIAYKKGIKLRWYPQKQEDRISCK
jgi:hypothetical protein